jgi:hypothetical protein
MPTTTTTMNIWAFMIETLDGERIALARVDGHEQALVTDTADDLMTLRPIARALSQSRKQRVRLVEFREHTTEPVE